MKYTVRYAHLERKPELRVGDIIGYGEVIGIMGNSGFSTGAHLHLDVAEGFNTTPYKLSDLEKGFPKPSPKQAAWFIDSELFGCRHCITTHYADPDYLRSMKKLHCGYDVVPVTRGNRTIHWNRSVVGKVLAIIDDPTGYGHCIHIGFDI